MEMIPGKAIVRNLRSWCQVSTAQKRNLVMGIRIQGQTQKIRQDHCHRVAGVLDKNTRQGIEHSIYYNFGISERLGHMTESKVLEVYILPPNYSHMAKQLSNSLKSTLEPSICKTNKLT